MSNSNSNLPVTPLESQWDSAIIRQLLYAGLGLVATILADIFGWTTTDFLEKGGRVIDSLLAFGVIAVPLFLAWRARRNKPTPPIEGTPAVAATVAREKALAPDVPATPTAVPQPGGKQKGYARALFLGLILAVSGASVAILSGCETLQQTAKEADSFSDRLAAAYAAVGLALDGALSMLQAHEITPQDAQKVQDKARQVRGALDLAERSYDVSQQAGEDKLAKAMAVAREVQRCVDVRLDFSNCIERVDTQRLTQ